VAGRAFQLAEWDRTHRFCGVCGTPTGRLADERARACPACAHRAYPRHSPAVIMRITRGDEVLLGRSSHFPPGMYSTLAGFVDVGESAEAAVRREVREEAGIEITEPQWFGSQSWAFPHSLMLGFTAEWASGDVVADLTELEDVQWFTRERLPVLPPPASIALRLTSRPQPDRPNPLFATAIGILAHHTPIVQIWHHYDAWPAQEHRPKRQ
jgi:NAD+ diphosphatase